MAPMEALALRAVALAAVVLALLAAPAVAAQQAGTLDPGYGDGGRVVLPVGDNALATAFALQPDDRALLRAERIYQCSDQRDLAIHTQILLAQLTLRHPHSQPVIADHGVPTTDRLPEARERLIAPIKLQMADPPRRTQQQRP